MRFPDRKLCRECKALWKLVTNHCFQTALLTILAHWLWKMDLHEFSSKSSAVASTEQKYLPTLVEVWYLRYSAINTWVHVHTIIIPLVAEPSPVKSPTVGLGSSKYCVLRSLRGDAQPNVDAMDPYLSVQQTSSFLDHRVFHSAGGFMLPQLKMAFKLNTWIRERYKTKKTKKALSEPSD
ncbi:uncharacterized protein UV8b_07975 [Ustilaginoidea virens]|uniref:Uncharacterized protein n=1 Tax=Ustilaginoidea virens TaxID=1159556 RepID=A0A8E5HY01_USTVR|nr:uncharacterized protein UV8b_07975 [Ustilaginoidea virens]QUC23734.1 hypothetical protein UV8b_07975 [Ustilaginoidea virens]